MIVDTSVIIAILLDEPEAATFTTMLAVATSCTMSAGSWIELTAVLVRAHPEIRRTDVMELISSMRIVIAPVTAEQATIGEAAYREYGRGTGHAAGLNFGDCFSYALAKTSGEPLLFKGDDFTHTDVQIASRP